MLITLLAAALPSLCAAAALLIIGSRRVERLAKPLALTAAGLLLTLATAHLLPEALHEGDAHSVGLCALITFMVLIVLEMALSVGQEPDAGQCAHSHQHALSGGAAGLLGGTLLHTFCDGVMIAAAFAADPGLGLAAAAAIFAHEVPQEMGDYALLLTLGFTRRRAFLINFTALCGMCAGALSSGLLLNQLSLLLPYALAAAAASFIYVALSDLLPRLRHTKSAGQLLRRLSCLALGVLLALLLCHH